MAGITVASFGYPNSISIAADARRLSGCQSAAECTHQDAAEAVRTADPGMRVGCG